MIFVVNKLGESLEYDFSKIKLVEKFNHLTYKISLDSTKLYDEIDFNTQTNAENEYPIMIIVEKDMKHLFTFKKNMKKNRNLRNKLIEKTINYGNKPYNKIEKYMLYAKIKTLWFNVKLYFIKLWYGGVLNKKIKSDKPETKDLFPEFCESYEILKSVNRTHNKVMDILKELKQIVIDKKIEPIEQERIFLSSINYL